MRPFPVHAVSIDAANFLADLGTRCGKIALENPAKQVAILILGNLTGVLLGVETSGRSLLVTRPNASVAVIDVSAERFVVEMAIHILNWFFIERVKLTVIIFIIHDVTKLLAFLLGSRIQ